jgi:LAO/AO transport system kinase
VIETVGVGQAEVAIASEADTTVVVLIPGAGDAVQAAKAGVLEIADIFVINKADLPGTESLHRAIDQLIEFSHQPGWLPRVVETSCFSGRGLDNLWRALAEHREYLSATDTTEERRVQRLSLQIDQTIEQRLRERVRNAIPDDVRKADIDALLAGSANLNEVIEHLWEIVITSLHQAQL